VAQVLGVGGIGKTTLTVQLAHDLAPEFAVVYWRSLRNAPPVEEWLAGVIDALSLEQASAPEGLDARLGLLLDLLRGRRALLALDNLEAVLAPGASDVRYRAGYEGYGTVLQRLAEGAHQGCLLLTSREQPLPADEAAVRALRLEGLGVDAGRALLSGRALRGDAASWQTLVARYGGNPLALRVVGETIGMVFGGDIAAFLAQDVAAFGGIRQLLDEQVGRLSSVERAILTILAVGREPVRFADVVADLGPRAPRGEVVEAVEALLRRSLLEWGPGGEFTLQPVVLEYATARLVERACAEALAGEPALLIGQPLVKATAKDYVRRSQERLIARPLLERLGSSLGSADIVERRLLELLGIWRGRPPGEQGDGPGNVVNLLRLLRGELRGLDLSHLVIRQAYLQGVEAQDVSLAGAHLSDVVLDEPFTYPTSVALSADGAYLAIGTSTGEVCLWRRADRTLLMAVQGHSGPILGVAVSADGQLVASGGFDGTAKLWEAEAGRPRAILRGHTGGVQGVALSGDGHVVASGGEDGTVRLWEAGSGQPRAILRGHTGVVWGVALSADGRTLVSGSQDGTARLWEAESGRLRATPQGHTGMIRSVALSADGRLMASGSWDGTARLWEAESGQLLTTLQGQTSAIWGVALSADGRLVASGSQDGTTRLWEVGSGRPRATLRGHTSGVRGVALSADGRLVVSGSWDGTARLWEAETGEPLAILQGHRGGVPSVALSADGRLVASGGEDGTVRLWEAEGGRLLATLQGHDGAVWGVALSGDGRLLASSSWDGTVRLWEVGSGQLLATLEGHTSEVWCVALSGDGRVAASGSFDGAIRLWEAPGGRLRATLQGHDSAVFSVALSANGRLVASSTFDGTVKLREAAGGRPLTTLEEHGNGIRCVALSADGRVAASGSYDGTLRLWEVTSGACLRTLRPDRAYERMDITGLTGVAEVKRVALRALGAVEQTLTPAAPLPPALSAPPSPTTAPPASSPGPTPTPTPEPDAARPSARPPTNLPPARTSFIGRAAEVAALAQALDPATGVGTRLLTLSGVAGSGKTRLALAVATLVRDGYGDGVWLVELAPLPAAATADPTAMAAATLGALGLREQPGQAPPDTLVARLQTRTGRLLLVLDNCEHVAPACAALAARLLGACPALQILVTSQRPLGIADETVWQVDTLAAPPPVDSAPTPALLRLVGQSEAAQLFVERARAVQPGFALSAENAASVAAICQRLDGLPLAIELAAARLHVLPVAELLVRLDDRFRLLRRGSRAIVDRHQTLQAALDWSYGLLDPTEQALLRRLAVFAGGWEVTAAEAVCSGDDVAAEAVLELLDELLERSLVYVYDAEGTPRYGLLETVRQYGAQQLERAGEAVAVQNRLLAWCATLAEQAAPAL